MLERFDAFYMVSLSDDAIPQILSTFDSLEGGDKAQFGRILARRYEERSGDEYSSWQSFNLSRRRGRELLSGRMEEIGRYRDDQDSL